MVRKRGADQAAQGGEVGHIRRVAESLAVRAQLTHRLVELALFAPGDDDARPGLEITGGDRLADAAGAADDQCVLARQAETIRAVHGRAIYIRIPLAWVIPYGDAHRACTLRDRTAI